MCTFENGYKIYFSITYGNYSNVCIQNIYMFGNIIIVDVASLMQCLLCSVWWQFLFNYFGMRLFYAYIIAFCILLFFLPIRPHDRITIWLFQKLKTFIPISFLFTRTQSSYFILTSIVITVVFQDHASPLFFLFWCALRMRKVFAVNRVGREIFPKRSSKHM